MKLCTLTELADGRPGEIIEISFVDDDHQFGVSPDGTRLHIKGSFIVTEEPGEAADG